jgi:F0F1-type ATP synthase assembly protein I
MIASIPDVVSTAPWAFLVGWILGFVVGARYRITKRNGK